MLKLVTRSSASFLAHGLRVFALRTGADKRKDAQVGIPKTLKGVPDRWPLYRVVG